MTRDQALLNNLAAQRDQLANASANIGADLDVARFQLEQRDARVKELEARVAELEAKCEPKTEAPAAITL